jgi:phosphatidylserine decarboxylase
VANCRGALEAYKIDGACHACNPRVVLEVATPYSKNRRTVTIIDTDVPGGSGVGLVAMVEVVALMIGRVRQCYSEYRYDDPEPVRPGLFVARGQPKSLFEPGSSTVVVLFQRGRVRWVDDLLINQRRPARSRYSLVLGQPLIETDAQVRSLLAWPASSAISKPLASAVSSPSC